MSITLQRWRRALWLLAIAWATPALSWAQYIGGNLVTNGTFSSQPTGTNLPPNTDLGGWISGRTYTGSGIYPAEGQVAGQTGTETNAGQNISQVPFPGDATNSIAASNTWLHYNGQTNGGIIWQQAITLVNGGVYVFSGYASNALAPTAADAGLRVALQRQRELYYPRQ